MTVWLRERPRGSQFSQPLVSIPTSGFFVFFFFLFCFVFVTKIYLELSGMEMRQGNKVAYSFGLKKKKSVYKNAQGSHVS